MKILKNRRNLPPCTEPEKGWENMHLDAVKGTLPSKIAEAYNNHQAECSRCYRINDSLLEFEIEVMGEATKNIKSERLPTDLELLEAGVKVLQRMTKGRRLPEDAPFLLRTIIW